jgi:hypothetical protein
VDAYEAAVKRVLAQLGSKNPSAATDFLKQIESDKQIVKGHHETIRQSSTVIVGRIALPEISPKQSPRIAAQMRFFSENYFSAHVQVGRPVGFRLHGFQPLDYVPKGSEGEVEFVGDLKMIKTRANQQSTVSGKLISGDGKGRLPSDVKVGVYTVADNINWSNNSGGDQGGGDGITLTGDDVSSASFRIKGLSPITYGFFASCRGYSSVRRTLRIEPSKNLDLGGIRLFQSRIFTVDAITCLGNQIQDQSVETSVMHFSQPFWPLNGFIPGRSTKFGLSQHGSNATLIFNYGSPRIVSLGDGSPDDFKKLSLERIKGLISPRTVRELQLVENRVYVFHDRSTDPSKDLWVIFRVRSQP